MEPGTTDPTPCDVACAADAAWFASHPLAEGYVRSPGHGEAPRLAGVLTPGAIYFAPPGWHPAVIVVVLGPGLRARKLVHVTDEFGRLPRVLTRLQAAEFRASLTGGPSPIAHLRLVRGGLE